MSVWPATVGDHAVMDPQEAAFVRMLHERVLNTLHVIILGEAPRALIAGTLEWIDNPSAAHTHLVPGSLHDLIEGAVRSSGVAGVVVDVPSGLEVRAEECRALVTNAIVEALRNADRHAAASRIAVRAERVDGRLRVVIEDDGSGFTEGSTPRIGLSVGIYGAMAEIGGRADVLSGPGRGTKVVLWLPHLEAGPSVGAEAVDVGLVAQWAEVAAGTRALLAELAAGESDAVASGVAERARIEDGRIRTWLSCHRADSWMVREVWRCVNRAADQGRSLQAAISGRGGIGEPSDLDLLPILRHARSVTVTLGPGWEELFAVVDDSEIDRWHPDPRVQVETVAALEGVVLVRMRRPG